MAVASDPAILQTTFEHRGASFQKTLVKRDSPLSQAFPQQFMGTWSHSRGRTTRRTQTVKLGYSQTTGPIRPQIPAEEPSIANSIRPRFSPEAEPREAARFAAYPPRTVKRRSGEIGSVHLAASSGEAARLAAYTSQGQAAKRRDSQRQGAKRRESEVPKSTQRQHELQP